MSERKLLDALHAIYAALNQPATFAADVAYAKQIAYDTLIDVLTAGNQQKGVN